MTDINKFQFLVKMGMPVDIASLIISKVSINTLDSPEELGKFLTGQKLKSKTAAPVPELEETVAYSVTSKQYLKENYADAKGLQTMFNTMTTSLDRSLKEAVLKSEKKYLKEND